MPKQTPSEVINQVLDHLFKKEKPDSFSNDVGLSLHTIYDIRRAFPLWAGLPKEGGRGRPRKPVQRR